jgi:polysaccharide export outer membrane protein
MNMTAFASVARHLRALFVLACCAAGLAGCAGVHPPMPQSTPASEDVYKVGPLDSLNIVVWRNTDLSGVVSVRPDGRISTPLVQDLPVAGKTPPEIAREIEKTLSKYVRDPNVTVLVNSFQGTFAEQIRIVGEATKPQAIAYRQNMTLLDVMIQAGGLTDFADGNSAVLVRNNVSYTVRLKDLLKRGDITANAQMAPGDVIIVPQSWF